VNFGSKEVEVERGWSWKEIGDKIEDVGDKVEDNDVGNFGGNVDWEWRDVVRELATFLTLE
jgi:hypothetical protein